MTTVDTSALDRLAEGVQLYHANKPWPQDWSYDRVEEEMDKYDDVLSWARSEHGMRDISDGGGRDRIAFTGGTAAGDEFVVKVSKSDGTQQNAEEVELWKSLPTAVRAHVAPIEAWSDDYRWIVARRASQGTPPGASKTVLDNLAEVGWTCSDVSPDNIGLLDGHPVLIDLGIGLRERP